MDIKALWDDKIAFIPVTHICEEEKGWTWLLLGNFYYCINIALETIWTVKKG
jgi:hypothetical protein